jgi:hypothetical protein
MKRLFNIVLAFAALSLTIACDQDVYDKGEGEYSLLRADFVDAHADQDRYVDYVITDDGDSLVTKPRFTANWIQTADSVYRVLLYYNSTNVHEAEAVQVGQVLTAIPKDPSRIKGAVKTDPLYLESVWTSRNGRYINLRLRVLTGVNEGEEPAGQVFGILNEGVRENAVEGRAAHVLRLYHNQNNQPQYYSHIVFLSVPLSQVRSGVVVLRVNTYDGEVEKVIVVNQ